MNMNEEVNNKTTKQKLGQFFTTNFNDIFRFSSLCTIFFDISAM